MSSKIVILVEGLDSGGIENYLLRFLKETSSNFSEVEIICKSGRIGILEHEFLAIPKVKITRFKLGIFNIMQLYKLYYFLKQSKPSTIVDFTGHFAALPIAIGKMSSIKNRIVFYRNSTDRFKKNFLKDLLIKMFKCLIKKNSTWILANSESAFLNYYPSSYRKNKKFKVIYNGINPFEFKETSKDLALELDIKENDFVIGHIGRLNEAKNHKTILKVAIQLCNEYSNVKFICCGLSVETLQSSVPDHLKDRVFLLPFRRDVKNVLATLNCYYFPSLTEGNPNALIEAMLFNIPIVASNINPIKECMPDSMFYNLVKPNDDQAACSLLREYINGKPLPFDYKEWAISKFDYKILFKEFLEIVKG